jgi:hypothetical protein
MVRGFCQQHQLAQASHPPSCACRPCYHLPGNSQTLFCNLLDTQIQRNIDGWQLVQACAATKVKPLQCSQASEAGAATKEKLLQWSQRSE